MLPEFSPPPLQSLNSNFLQAHQVRVRVLRLDLIHPQICGNKWYKLKINFALARQQGYRRLLSFGGAYSNHLYALAAAARYFGLESIGLVRGELVDPLNPVLSFARAQGMQLHPVERSKYRQLCVDSNSQDLQLRFGPCYVIPEGGRNAAGVQGCTEIVDSFRWQYGAENPRFVLLACGTGTTLTGLVAGCAMQFAPEAMPTIIGVCVLKGGEFLQSDISRMLTGGKMRDPGNWEVATDFHAGGYARTSPTLLKFMANFTAETGIPLEPVYSGKAFHALWQMIAAGRIPAGADVIIVHTGGIIP